MFEFKIFFSFLKFCLLILYVIFFCNCNEKKMKMDIVKIIGQDKVSEFLKSQNLDMHIDFSYQIESNQGFVYNLKDGRYFMHPNGGVDNDFVGLIFKNKEDLDNTIKNETWPVTHLTKTKWEILSDYILKIDTGDFEYFLNFLCKKYKVENKGLSLETMNSIKKKIAIKKEFNDNEVLLSYSILVGEIHTRKFGSKWNFYKDNGLYFSYLRPVLINENGDKICNYFDSFLTKSLFYNWDVEKCLTELKFYDIMYVKRINEKIITSDHEEIVKRLKEGELKNLNETIDFTN